jgi:hypothetical protein
MSVSSSSTLKDDVSTTSNSTSSSHTAQPSDVSTPSPPQPFLDAIEEASPDPMLLADEVETTPGSDAYDDAVSEQIDEDYEAQAELEEKEGLTREDANDVDTSESSEEDGIQLEAEDEEEEEDSNDDDASDETGSSDFSDHRSYDEDDFDEEPTDIFAFTPSFSRPTLQRTQQNREAWRKFYPDDPSDDSADDDMNLDRIEDILFLAECRLRDQEKALERFTPSTTDIPTSTTLQESRLPKPYMRSSDKIVRPDPKALVNPKMRALANKPRVVTELVSIQKVGKNKGM